MPAAIQSHSQGAQTSLSANVSCPAPAGIAVGDLLFALVYTDNGSGGLSWASANGMTGLTPSSNGGTRAFWKIATASEPANYGFTAQGVNGNNYVAMMRVTGHSPSNPIADSGIVQFVSQTGATLPSVTAAQGDTGLIQFLSSPSGSSTFTPPGGTTEVFDTNGRAGGQQTVEPGPTGTRGWGGSENTGTAAAIFAVNPAVTGNVKIESGTIHGSTTTGGNAIFDKPTGTVEGNLLVCFIQDGSGVSWTVPSGWTLITGSGGGENAWYKVAGAAEPATYTWTPGITVTKRGVMVRISGHDPTTPIDTAAFLDQTSTTGSVVLPSVTASAGQALINLLTHSTNVTYTPQIGMTEAFDANGTPAASSAAAGYEPVAAGATGTRTWTTDPATGGGAGVAFLVNPSVGTVAANPALIQVRYKRTLTGAGNFTVPPGVTSITVECEGPGGAGGNGSATSRGGGGGGGAWARSTLTVTPGTVYPYVVGQTVPNNATTPTPSTFGSGTPLVRGAAGGNGGNGGVAANGALGPGGTVANSIGTDRTAGANGLAGNSGGAGASGGSITGGAGGTTGAAINGVEPGGGGGGGAGVSSGPGGQGARGLVVVTWSTPDVLGESKITHNKDVGGPSGSGGGKVLNVVGEGLSSHTKLTTASRTFSILGEGLSSRGSNAMAISRTSVGEGLSSMSRAVSASHTVTILGEGLTSRGTLPITLARSVVGEGLTSSTRVVIVAKTFTVSGEGLATESRNVQAVRVFNVVGEGLTSRGGLEIVRPFTIVGEGLSSGTKSVIAARTFTIPGEGAVTRTLTLLISRSATGEGFVTEVHPVQAYRVFNVAGEGLLLMTGPNGSTITIPLDELPAEGGGTTIVKKNYTYILD